MNDAESYLELLSPGGDANTGVLGLHFAGHHERRNRAHATERITGELTAAALPPPVGSAP